MQGRPFSPPLAEYAAPTYPVLTSFLYRLSYDHLHYDSFGRKKPRAFHKALAVLGSFIHIAVFPRVQMKLFSFSPNSSQGIKDKQSSHPHFSNSKTDSITTNLAAASPPTTHYEHPAINTVPPSRTHPEHSTGNILRNTQQQGSSYFGFQACGFIFSPR